MGLNILFTKRKSESIGIFKEVSFLVKYFEDLGFDVSHQDSFEVSKEDVEVLLSRCKQVIKKHSLAEELLPTVEGFGYDAYNETYYSDVRAIRDFIKDILLPQFDGLQDNETINFEILY